MTLFDIDQALREAKEAQSLVDQQTDRIARLLLGRLRTVGSNHSLNCLKKELSNYNAHTGKWRDK